MDLTCRNDVQGPLRVPVSTPVGPGLAHVERPAGSAVRGRLVLGHGAGGGVVSPDLDAAARAGLAAGLEVVRFEQPWRVAGRKVAVAPPRLDEAWLALLEALEPLPTVLGGRSAGARVACRTANDVPGVVGVLCLAFPLQPPSGRPSRQAELDAPAVPVLVVQGSRDGFGVPQPATGRRVVVVEGADHSFAARRVDGVTRADVSDAVRRAVADWLAPVLGTGQALT